MVIDKKSVKDTILANEMMENSWFKYQRCKGFYIK